MKDMKHAVSIVVINEDGLVCHVSRKDNHDDWALIGGKVDPEDNGSCVDAAIRETKEETGLDISNLREVFSMHNGEFMGHTYLADYTGEVNFDPVKEPHLVEWKPFKHAMRGSFGVWNTRVLESLNSMGIRPKVL